MRRARFHAVAILLIVALAGVPAAAQQPETPRERLRVFLDCGACDFDYLRREIEFIDYVRDRTEAELHVLVTTQGTGSGGTEYVFKFIGLGRFAGVDDELKYSSAQTDTRDERREGYARVLKLGLVRYVTSTSLADRLRLVYESGGRPAAAAVSAHDPWNYWVFRGRFNLSVSGEQLSSARNYSGSFSANRVTDDWKFTSGANVNFRRNRYTLSDGEELIDKTHDHSASAMLVKSLGDHWAAAVRGRIGSSTFVNQDRALRAAAGVEYSFFPYRESSRRELIAQLTIGVDHFDYMETTIYGKDTETVGDALLLVGYNLQQPWGSSDVGLETIVYFHDPSRHRLELDGNIDVRLFKGFSLNVNGGISRIRDQLYLPAGDATDEEILLRRRQLATSYRYRFSTGFSYTFGSIFNNIVNTRF